MRHLIFLHTLDNIIYFSSVSPLKIIDTIVRLSGNCILSTFVDRSPAAISPVSKRTTWRFLTMPQNKYHKKYMLLYNIWNVYTVCKIFNEYQTLKKFNKGNIKMNTYKICYIQSILHFFLPGVIPIFSILTCVKHK